MPTISIEIILSLPISNFFLMKNEKNFSFKLIGGDNLA